MARCWTLKPVAPAVSRTYNLYIMNRLLTADRWKMVPIAIVSLVIAVGVYACKDEGCSLDEQLYCEDNVIYRCKSIEDGSFFHSGPNSEYVAVIDCAKYKATCQEGVIGYVPRSPNSLIMDLEQDFACVATDYDCDSGDPSECYYSATVSCDMNIQIPVITNTVDNDPFLYCK